MPVADVGDMSIVESEITAEDIDAFAELSSDTNPLHLDDEYAAESLFDGRIAHGILTAGVISAAIADLPGDIVYLEQELTFENPVTPGDTIRGEVEVLEQVDSDRIRVDTKVFTVVDGERTSRVIDGEAQVISTAHEDS